MVKQILLVSLLTLFLSSCSNVPLKLLSGGSGTNVAANTQIGKENTQNLGVITTTQPKLRVEAPVDKIVQDTSTTKITEVDPLMLLLLVLGWLAPSPSEIGRGFLRLFRINKD